MIAVLVVMTRDAMMTAAIAVEGEAARVSSARRSVSSVYRK
jgi:hypothetical protein